MNKLTLDPEALRVQSFATGEAAETILRDMPPGRTPLCDPFTIRC